MGSLKSRSLLGGERGTSKHSPNKMIIKETELIDSLIQYSWCYNNRNNAMKLTSK